MQKSSKIILGIDPGTIIMGFSVIHTSPSSIKVVEMDVLKMQSQKDNYQRLQMIYAKVCELVTNFQPHEFAIEAPFFGNNVQSMLKLGRAQGVAIAAAMEKQIPVTEYSPKKVKQSITGNGNATKEQIWSMLQNITALPAQPKYFDASDALAVAICHHYSFNAITTVKTKKVATKAASGWEKFIVDNKDRVTY